MNIASPFVENCVLNQTQFLAYRQVFTDQAVHLGIICLVIGFVIGYWAGRK